MPMSAERKFQKIDPRYRLASDIDPEFKESFINAPRHLKFPTRNHFAFLEGIAGVNPRKERGVWMDRGYEYFMEEADEGEAVWRGKNVIFERPITPEEEALLKDKVKILSGVKDVNLTLDEAYELLRREVNKMKVISLDKPIISLDGDEMLTLAELIPAEKEVEEPLVEDVSDIDIIDVCRQIMTPREFEVIDLRLGLSDGQPKTLNEIGKRFGVTRERIRQIQAKALQKTRKSPQGRQLLIDYLR